MVAAAIARGLERAGVVPLPDVCPVSGGGQGLIEVLLPVLGGETGDGFALIDGGGTALVELGSSAYETGSRVARAVDAGAEVVVVAAGGAEAPGHGIRGAGDDQGPLDPVSRPAGPAGMSAARDATIGRTGEGCGPAALEAIEDGGGLRGATLVVLCETKAAWQGRAYGNLRRDPRGVTMTAAGAGLAGVLWARYGAQLVSGPQFVLEQLGFDARMRAARAVIVGEARLDAGTLGGRAAGEIAVRARQAGVPCHAVVGVNAIDPFDARILDLQAIVEAATIAELEQAGQLLTERL